MKTSKEVDRTVAVTVVNDGKEMYATFRIGEWWIETETVMAKATMAPPVAKIFRPSISPARLSVALMMRWERLPPLLLPKLINFSREPSSGAAVVHFSQVAARWNTGDRENVLALGPSVSSLSDPPCCPAALCNVDPRPPATPANNVG